MRYSRQERLKEIGKKGQLILSKKTVTIVGLGALGTNTAQLLARSGINLKLIDFDKVDLTNLQRQALYEESDINKELEKQNLGDGEKAAISLSIARKINIVLLDERKARRIAKFYKLEPKGTIGVLSEALNKNKISKSEFKELIQKLIKEGYRISEEIIMGLLKDIK